MPFNPVPVEEIPEVAAYEEAKEMLELFRTRHPKVFEAYDALLDSLDQKRGAADKVVRGRKVSCGDWDWYQTQVKVDSEALLNAIGAQRFLEIGGTASSVVTYKIDKETVKAAEARQLISEDIAKKTIIEVPKYHAPKS